MRCKTLIILMVLVALCPALLIAVERDGATPFTMPRIKAIAKATRISIPRGIGANADNDSTWEWKGKRLRVCTDSKGMVCHIGYRLFHPDIMQAYQPPTVLRFIERYVLELELGIGDKNATQRMDVDGVAFTEGNSALLKGIGDEVPFSLDNITRRMYKASWRMAKGNVTMVFPSDCQLIFGGNAVDLETSIRDRLIGHPELSDESLLQPWRKANEQRRKEMRLIDYGTYLSPLIGSRVYMVMRNSRWQLYCDRNNRVRSVSNIMLTGISDRDLPLRIVLDRYGYTTDTLTVTLRQFASFCQEEGCKTFLGIKTVDDNAIAGTLFIYNEALGYNHVLSFTFPTGLLDGEKGTVEARLYAYVPLHNVTDRYFNKNNYHDYNYDE